MGVLLIIFGSHFCPKGPKQFHLYTNLKFPPHILFSHPFSPNKSTTINTSPITPYHSPYLQSITLPSYRTPYRKIQTNSYQLSSRPLRKTHHKSPKITRPSHLTPINPSHQSMPFSNPNFQQRSPYHTPYQIPMFPKHNLTFFHRSQNIHSIKSQ